MSISVNYADALTNLNNALKIATDSNFKPTSAFSQDIGDVILGSHLTYRYILISNILAKATNPQINTIALQANANLKGAFDARSLCHKIFVPFERVKLDGKLGSSNEPFLNKPARYTELSASNPVRKGNDKTTLLKAIAILTKVNTQALAKQALSEAIYFTLQRNNHVSNLTEFSSDTTFYKTLTDFISLLLTTSQEGEIPALLTGVSFSIYGESFNEEFTNNLKIIVHPVNQAGSSSNEILDVDVYLGSELYLTAEVKDKVFTFEDVQHAANKVRSAGFNKFFFIMGPNSKPNGMSLSTMTMKIADLDVKVSFVNIYDFINTLIGLSDDEVDTKFVWDKLMTYAKMARIKDLTRIHLVECGIKAGLITQP